MEEIYFLRLWQWFKQMFAIIQEGCGSGWCRFTHRVMSACRGHHPGLWTLCGQRTVRAVRVFSNTPLQYTLCINRGRRLPLQLSPERFMLHSTMILQILLEPRSSNALAMIVAFIERLFFSSSVVMIKLLLSSLTHMWRTFFVFLFHRPFFHHILPIITPATRKF